jgi:uncharacterized integral membrane protein (TIGR00697 family)
MRENLKTYLFTTYVALLVAALAGGGKLATVGPFTFTATMFLYGLAGVAMDLTHELYGRADARRLAAAGLFGVMLATLAFQIVLALPASPALANAGSYDVVLGATPRLFVAGMTAYFISTHVDVWLFARLRAATGGRWLWLRNNTSNMGSQLVDTAVFMTLGFGGADVSLLGLVAGQFLVKTAVTLLYTPLLYGGVYVARGGTRQMCDVPDAVYAASGVRSS